MTCNNTNRSADEMMAEMDNKFASNKIQNLGRQHITEAHSVEEPLDWSAFINLEISPYDNKKYMTLKRQKCRWEESEVKYFAQELVDGYYLMDDIHLPEGEYTSKAMIMSSEADEDIAQNVFNTAKRGPTRISTPNNTEVKKEVKSVEQITKEVKLIQTGMLANKPEYWIPTKQLAIANYFMNSDWGADGFVNPNNISPRMFQFAM